MTIARKKPSKKRDLLHALALMDATAGDGGDFWAEYADAMLPPPAALTLPLCWDDALLAELRHEEMAAAARAQRERLHALFPGLSAPAGVEASTSWLQWAFACVRSRAFKVGAEAWATAPFLDMGALAVCVCRRVRGFGMPLLCCLC
jgi:hypothetical protein